MFRLLLVGGVTAILCGCQLPADRASLRPLPDEVQPVPYAELLTRARAQASIATEAFYVNRWNDLEEAAHGLEVTARYLPKAEDVPPANKDSLIVVSGDLGKEAISLRDAAKTRDVKKTNEILQVVNLKIRELRLEK
jgi:hypothetical protein